MYAIVEIAGQQFKVEKEQEIYVHRLEGEAGSTVEFDSVLFFDNDGKIDIGNPLVDGVLVRAKIVEHLKGDKVLVFHKKRRKGYQKENGHRQYLSKLVIEDILTGAKKSAKASSAKASEEKKEVKKVEAKKDDPKEKDKKAEPKKKKKKESPSAKAAKDKEIRAEPKKEKPGAEEKKSPSAKATEDKAKKEEKPEAKDTEEKKPESKTSSGETSEDKEEDKK